MNKKILFFLCLIAFIVSIAGVSATDDVNQTVSNDLSDTLGVSLSDVEIVGGADNGTFADLQKKINAAKEGAVIILENDYEVGYDYYNQLDISKSITIDGDGHTIDGKDAGETRLIYIGSGASNVLLKNINFINGIGFYDNGGFIYSESPNLTIDACNFTDCKAYLSNGGAVYSPDYDAVLTITSCNFISNEADNGAAVYSNGPLTVSNCNFEENSGGSAVYSSSDLTVVSCNFNDNDDGAIFADGDAAVSYSNFTGNSGSDGGAICCNGDLTVNFSNFVNNSVYSNGGAIYSAYSLTVVGSNFVNNFGDMWWCEGGAIFSETGDAYIINSTFANNSPNDYYPEDIYTENVVKSSHIDLDLGAGTFTIDEDVEITITLDDGATGEVILTIDGVEETLTLEDNRASLTKSGFDIGSYDVLVRYSGDDSFSPNEKSTSFKVVEASFDELQRLIYDLEDGDILNLTKDYTYIDSSIGIYNLNIRINGNGHSLNGNGRRIMNIHDSYVVLENIKFEDACEEWEDAAINSYESNLNVINCDFTGNGIFNIDFDCEGVAIHFENGNLTVTGSNFINNTGGSTIYSYNGIVDITDSNFINNSQDKYAVHVIGGKITYDNLTFINNLNISFEKFSVHISVYNYDNPVLYPNNAVLTISADKDDYFYVYVNDKYYSKIKLIEYKDYELELSNLPVGSYEVKVTFKGDESYNDAEASDYFVVKKPAEISLGIEKDVLITDDYQIIQVSLPKDATGSVYLDIDDDYYGSSEINNGIAVFNLTDFTTGKYKVSVYYDGDDIYTSNSSFGEFVAVDQDAIFVYAEDTSNLRTLRIDVYVGTLLPVEVVVSVDSIEYHAIAVGGHAWVEIYRLKTGEYEVIATYLESEATTTVTVMDATFTDLQNAIDALDEGETLYLNGDVKKIAFEDDNSIFFGESEININKAITIDGMGYTIDANNWGRIFNITSDNVVLRNITFVNGLLNDESYYDIDDKEWFIRGNGSAIYSEKDLTIINSLFVDNTIENLDSKGGAIYIEGDLRVINSIFTSNGIFYDGGSLCGGAIYSTGTVDISDSTFTGNYLSGQYVDGGAISANTVNVNNSVFTDNYVYVEGSGDWYWDDVSSCGGAISAKSVNIRNSDFTNNRASWKVKDIYESIIRGGAVYSTGYTNIESSTFVGNDAEEGQALWAYAMYSSIDDDTTFINNDYVLEKVSPEMIIDFSSPIFNVGDTVVININFNNTVMGYVSVRVNDDERIIEVIDDSVTLTVSDVAKGIYNVNVTFIENEYCGYASVTDRFKVIDVPFATFTELQNLIDNAIDGDSIYLTKYYIYDEDVDQVSLSIEKNITIIGNGNTIDGNRKTNILEIWADNVVLNNIVFIEGFGMSAGAIYNNGNLDVINCNFENNTITERGIYPDLGGAIYSLGNLNVINSSFRFNKAPLNSNEDRMDHGGAIASEGNLTVINSLFVGNCASFGGAISGDNVVAINSIFINNTATRKPGAIDAYNQTIINCTFENNIPNDYKHDIYMYIHYDENLYRENDNVTIFVNVYDNIKSVKIDVSGIEKTVDIVNETARLTLNNCDAGIYEVIVSYDGDDYYDSKTVKSSFTVIDDSYGTFEELQEIIDNASDGDTIALSKNYIYDYDEVDDVQINKNVAIRGNGHIIDGNRGYGYFGLNAENVLLDNLIFTNFKYTVLSEWDDDLEYPDANLTITNCIFKDNYEDVYRIISLDHTNLAVIDSEFINNQVYTNIIFAGSVNIANSTFKNNIATSASTPVCSINGYNITVTDSTFEDNTYAISTGEIKVFDIYCKDTLFVDGSTFINNSTDMNDYIYVESGRKTVTNSKFINKNQTPGTANINIFTSDIDMGENLVVDVLVSDDATGKVTLSINNKEYTKNLVNSKATFTVSGLSVGTYDLVVYYSGDATFNATQASTKVKVSKADTVISAPDVNIAYNNPSAELVATIVNEHGKPLVVNLNINFNGENYTVKTDSDGRASIAIGTLKPGTYAATISYKGSSNYKASTASAKVTVTKSATVISAPNVNIAYKDPSAELVATIVNEHGKPLVVNLNVDFNGKTYTVKTDSNGQMSLPIDTLSPGTYTATISYKGSSNYKASTATAKVTVTKSATVISAPNVNIAYKDPSGELVATIVNEHGKPLVVNLNVELNGKTYTVKTDSNGQATVSIPTLTPGTYTATISYKGSSNYKASTATAKVTVTKSATVISAPNVNIAYKDPSGELVATIVNEHGKPLVVNLNVELNGKTYTVKTDSNGQATVSIPTLTPGTYTATISYKGSSNYKASTATAKVTVTKSATVISAPNVNIAYKDPSGELVATIVNEHGKPLVVNLNVELNGKTYTVKTDSNGQATVSIPTLTPGTYTATISYKGSSNYKASTATAKVTVTKSATVISAPNVNIAYKDPNGQLVATITNEHGKPLVVSLNINLNGKDYTVKTDSNGQASLSIDTLTPGTYTATISYKGSSNYKASSTTAKVTVTKSATVISAPDVSVSYGNPNGKLVSTITNEHGKPLVVNLNVDLNGKTYTAKTDSNGQISVSTADLAPGTYTATISYKGSSNYKATSTTAKIVVKQ